MRYLHAVILALLVCVSALPVEASWRHEQQVDLLVLAYHAKSYQLKHGVYPLTDRESTWYEKLVAEYGTHVLGIRETSLEGKYPLDLYGHPLVYEPPDANHPNEVVIRSVGENGVDNHGLLDDWDSRSEPNSGYWYKSRWPAAKRFGLFCAVISLGGLVFIIVKIDRFMAKLFFAAVWLGLMSAIIFPIGFSIGWPRGPQDIDPAWIGFVPPIGYLLLFSSIPILFIHIMYSAWITRSLRLPGTLLCAKCHYDLRGTIESNRKTCPECGESIPQEVDIDVDLTSPPSP